MSCLSCGGYGCERCGKVGEQSLSMEEVDANLKEAELKVCRRLLGQYIERVSQLERRIEKLEGKE